MNNGMKVKVKMSSVLCSLSLFEGKVKRLVHFRRWSSMVFFKNLMWSSTVKKWSSTPKKWSSTPVELHFLKKWSSTPIDWPKCICVFHIVFVFVFDFVFVYLSFCICLLLFIHQRALSGWGSEISLGLLKADDDDEEFYYNTQIGRNPEKSSGKSVQKKLKCSVEAENRMGQI